MVIYYKYYHSGEREGVTEFVPVSSEDEVHSFSYTTDPDTCPTKGVYYLGPCEYHDGSTTNGNSGCWYYHNAAYCRRI